MIPFCDKHKKVMCNRRAFEQWDQLVGLNRAIRIGQSPFLYHLNFHLHILFISQNDSFNKFDTGLVLHRRRKAAESNNCRKQARWFSITDKSVAKQLDQGIHYMLKELLANYQFFTWKCRLRKIVVTIFYLQQTR